MSSLCFLAFLCVSTELSAASVTPVALVLSLESDAAVSSAEVRLRVEIQNQRGDCTSVYIDPFLSPFDQPNRGSTLTFEVIDSAGRIVPGRQGPPPDVSPMKPSELIPIDCGFFYGFRTTLAVRSAGAYELPAGTYRVRARLRLKTKKLLARRSQIEELRVLRRISQEDVLKALPEGEFVSKDVEFRIVAAAGK